MVNRKRGSGTRLWLDHQLERLSISPQRLRGYDHEVRMHTAVAAAVQQGTADVGLGLLAAARQFELDFIPLFQERFDLVVPKEKVDDRSLMRTFDYLVSGEFRRTLDELGGYETSHTGEQITP
jgi:putative molybdopterin biosynthesis protein